MPVFTLQGIKKSSTSNVSKPLVEAAQAVTPSLARIAGKNYTFVRVAAVSGAAAVCLAAYGKHKFKGDTELRGIYESANQMHLIHSVVLLAVPLTRRPFIVSFFVCFSIVKIGINGNKYIYIFDRAVHCSSLERLCSAAPAITRQSRRPKAKK